MEYLTDIDEFQAALKMVNVNEDMNVTKSNNVLLEGVELDCYHKCQKILDTPEMKKCHKRCLDVNFDELNESDIDTINELYDLGIERGLISPDAETEPEENPEDQMDDQNVQEPLKDVGDGCELDDVDGDAYWDMKRALRECGEYGSIDKSIEEEIMDEEYPGNDEEVPPDEQIPEDEDPAISEDPQSDELTPPDGYDEDELIAALDDKDVAPSDSELEKMEKAEPEVNDDDMPFEAEGDDTASDSDGTSTEDTTSDTEGGDEVQDVSTDDTTDSSDAETTSDDTTGADDVETGDEGVEDETSDTETDSTEDTSTDDSETEDTTTTDDADDTSTEDSDTDDGEEENSDDKEEDDTEDSEDEEEESDDEDKPEEKDLTADAKAQLKNEYTNMFSDIVKGMLSDVEAEDGEKAELCVKDMTPEQKSEFWGKVAEQWEGKADPADFMSASELESLENKVEKKEKEESSRED